MDLIYSPEQEQIRDAARGTLERHVTHEARLAAEKTESGYDPELWSQMAELGWLTAASEESAFEMLAILAEQMGRTAVATPFPQVASAIMLLSAAELSPQGAELSAKLAAGETVTVPGPAKVTARDEGGLRLSAGRQLVLWANTAPGFLVQAKTPAGATGLFHVRRDAPGVTISPVRLVDNVKGAWVTFDGVAPEFTAAESVSEAELAKWNEKVLLLGAAEATACAHAAVDLTVEYVKERVQFGRAIGSFQAVQHGLADSRAFVEAAWLAVWEGVSSIALGEPRPSAGALAAWLAERAIQDAAVAGSQYHGGMGVTLEYPMHYYYRRAAATHARLGTQYDLLGKIADTYVDRAGLGAYSAFLPAR